MAFVTGIVVRNILAEAINNMTPSTVRRPWCPSLRLPKDAPMMPPIMTAMTRGAIKLKSTGRPDCAVAIPPIPDKEFTRINGALIAAVCFAVAQPKSSTSGLKKIPPPTPTTPLTIPMKAPVAKMMARGGLLVFSEPLMGTKRRTAANNKITPNIGLYVVGGTSMNPPRNAAGILAHINGTKRSLLHVEAFANFHVPIDATTTFNNRAVGRIWSGTTPESASIAKYPDPPP